MRFTKISFISVTTFILLLSQATGLRLSAQTNFPENGIYDGKVGNDQLVLVAETNNSGMLKGYFVLNRGKAVEESHAFSMNTDGSRRFFQSDLYLGKIKSGKQGNSSFEGTMILLNKRKFFFFRRPKTTLNFVRRTDPVLAPTPRYQKEIFSNVEVKSNILYGKAKGLWTSSPYTDDPYIEVLGNGLIKTFDDPELLDLNMDIYYPKTDIFKNRPLVMLIHGGAFYIGSKESVAEKSLATSLAKCGYLVASIDYRLGFKLLPSDMELSAYRAVQDAHAALRFLAHNAKGLGINPDQVYVGGTSAGAVASLSVAFMNNNERPKRILEADRAGLISGIEFSGNKYNERFTIKSVANMWGAVSDLNILGKDDQISVLSIHGTADGIVPYEYDHPFQNSLMVNRLMMDKMYGSKPIHDRLQMLGKRNLLVSLKGLGHEPELERFNKLNHYMDTITNHVTRFFYEETAPSVMLPPNQLTISENAGLTPIYYEVNNGFPVQVQVSGGVKANSNPTDATIIWLKDNHSKKLTILTTNKFEAWNAQSFPVVTKNQVQNY